MAAVETGALPRGVPLDAGTLLARLEAERFLAAPAADGTVAPPLGEALGAAGEQELSWAAAAAVAEEEGAGPEAVAAAQRLRAGQARSGDLWLLLSCFHFEALAQLPAQDRDEFPVLAALEPSLRRLLDAEGLRQVGELLDGESGAAVQRARVLKRLRRRERGLCPPRLAQSSARCAPSPLSRARFGRQAAGG